MGRDGEAKRNPGGEVSDLAHALTGPTPAADATAPPHEGEGECGAEWIRRKLEALAREAQIQSEASTDDVWY